MRKSFLLFVLVGLALSAARLLASDPPWQFDYEKALAEAKAQHRPVLIDFSASWCGPCRMMETTTFSDEKVQKVMSDYTLVKIDIDRNQMLAARYKVQAIPTCIVLNEFADTVDRHTGYADAMAFSHWLTASQNLDRAEATEPASQAVADKVKQLGTGLESPDAAVRDNALAGLLDVCCARVKDDDSTEDTNDTLRVPDPSAVIPVAEGDLGAKLAEEQLRSFVQRHAPLAAEHLNDHRLAVRMLFTRLFAEKAGADFRFDPWAPAPARVAAAESWAKQVARVQKSPDVAR